MHVQIHARSARAFATVALAIAIEPNAIEGGTNWPRAGMFEMPSRRATSATRDGPTSSATLAATVLIESANAVRSVTAPR